jgi:hypothetical protein
MGGQSDEAKHARADTFGNGSNGATLPRSVSSLKNNDDAQALVFHPILQSTEVRLQPPQFFLIFFRLMDFSSWNASFLAIRIDSFTANRLFGSSGARVQGYCGHP